MIHLYTILLLLMSLSTTALSQTFVYKNQDDLVNKKVINSKESSQGLRTDNIRSFNLDGDTLSLKERIMAVESTIQKLDVNQSKLRTDLENRLNALKKELKLINKID